MTATEDAEPLLLRPWVAIGGGLLAGALAAIAVMSVWTYVRDGSDPAIVAVSAPDVSIPYFRSAHAANEIVVLPAGPDGRGERQISLAAYPDELPPRELVTVLFANVARSDAWEVDLTSLPLRVRGSSDEWLLLEPVSEASLPTADRMRAHALGSDVQRTRIEPGSLRRVLLALPAGQQFPDVSDVQWGARTFRRGEFGVEDLHAYREDPATEGRRADAAEAPRDPDQDSDEDQTSKRDQDSTNSLTTSPKRNLEQTDRERQSPERTQDE